VAKTQYQPSQAYLHECFVYNPETGVLIWKERPLHHFKSELAQRRLNAQHAGKLAGSPARYIKIKFNGRYFLAHRLIIKMMTGEWPVWTDHIDGNKHNNRWANLRSATPQQNGWNRRPSGSVLPRGVGPSKNGTRYVARIHIQGVKTHIGTYDTPEEAYAAWCAHARERGEFFRAD